MDKLKTLENHKSAKRERRKSSRKGLIGGATLAYDRNSNLVGKIISLSQTGLSFEYAGPAQRTLDSMHIDILNSTTYLPHLTEIGCRTVYDITDLVERQSFRGAAVRRCGLEFIGLSEEQHSDLLQLMGAQLRQQPVP